MTLNEGTHKVGPETGHLLVKTGRTGMGRRAGHDLTLEPARWEGTIEVVPADPTASSVAVSVDAGSLEVREGTGGVKPLTGGDRGEIQSTLREKILHTDRHPTITFRSSRVTGTPADLTIEGDLTIMDVTRPVTIRAAVADDRLRGGATITQSEWGIKPYSAFFGALKLADEVEIAFDLAL
ncbi:YceI family protein [Actinomadura sp. HBU206391]|uniref:YceI family protein n=1 Tax=Actinomadura sp. HBU206391 TaxID=2731692 RepID=UPI00164EE49B|nr:YceI family protein [Actinomadura sp. HBU206391]MBC6460530.1 YceI family protein [Actinomadura sp. HBU206391]